MAVVSLESVTVETDDGMPLVTDVSFQVDDGEHVVLIGPSGAGKTTVIRAVSGLQDVSAGTVLFDGVDFTETAPKERDVGMVFQHGSLFPHMSAGGNVGFPLKVRDTSAREIDKRVHAEARALGIDSLLERWPRELSAGHRQLVEIARAMVRVPRVLLLDEPMAHLDPPVRQRLRHDLKELQRGYGVTTLHATNDPIEAMSMADRLVALTGGNVSQVGTPAEVSRAPTDVSIAWLTGPISFVAVEVHQDSGGLWLAAEGLRLRAWAPALADQVGQTLRIGVRPDAIRLLDNGGNRAVVEGRSFESGRNTSILRIGGASVSTKELPTPDGTEISIGIDHYLVYGADDRLIAAVGS